MSKIIDQLTKIVAECEVNFNLHGASYHVLMAQLKVNKGMLKGYEKLEQRIEKLENHKLT